MVVVAVTHTQLKSRGKKQEKSRGRQPTNGQRSGNWKTAIECNL